MNKQHKVPVAARQTQRPGEGVSIDVVHQTLPQPDGTTLMAAGINLSSAPVPDKRYVADWVSVLYRRENLKLVFAQETFSFTSQTSPSLRSMLVVNMGPDAARNFLRSLQQMRSPNLDELVISCAIKPEPLLEVEQEPEQTIAFAANMVAVAIMGRDTCLDFYQASPFDMVNIATAKRVPIDPVVRIDLRTSLLVSIRNAMQKLEGDFPSETMAVMQVMKE